MTIHQILKHYWGYDSFRPTQQEIIEEVLKGNDSLALLPTGGGKSICFQVPALAMQGLCIVISPLIALMKDQVETLQKAGIKAQAIYSGIHHSEIDIILKNCIHGGTKFLYLSPERLSSQLFRDYLPQLDVCLLAVDEAHCISQWGFDFRPEYRRIAEIREIMPAIPVLALTASATKEVVEDIQVQLGFKKKLVFKNSFERLNLHYVVRVTERKMDKMLDIIKKTSGSGLIYVRNRKKTEELAEFLVKSGINASFYHAGLSNAVRVNRQENWIKNKTRMMVCTNAFGMGIDKPDCKVVIHFEMPDCLEAYYQEAGRAGRNGDKSYCVLLYNEADQLELRHRIEQNFPPEEMIRKVYDALGSFLQIPLGKKEEESFDFDLTLFSKYISLNQALVFSSIKLLSQLGYVLLNEAFYAPSRLQILLRQKELYAFQVEHEPHDELIKLILRSYGGIFDQLCVIHENFLAMKMNVSEREMGSKLKQLHDLQVLNYLPQTDKPQILLLTERVEAKYLNLNQGFIRKRKELFEHKLNQMVNYASSEHLCRSRMLLSYFDEDNALDCGSCDICIEKRRRLIDSKEYTNIELAIKNTCSVSPIEIRKLIENIPNHKPEDIIGMIRILLDKNIIKLNAQQLLFWQVKN